MVRYSHFLLFAGLLTVPPLALAQNGLEECTEYPCPLNDGPEILVPGEEAPPPPVDENEAPPPVEGDAAPPPDEGSNAQAAGGNDAAPAPGLDASGNVIPLDDHGDPLPLDEHGNVIQDNPSDGAAGDGDDSQAVDENNDQTSGDEGATPPPPALDEHGNPIEDANDNPQQDNGNDNDDDAPPPPPPPAADDTGATIPHDEHGNDFPLDANGDPILADQGNQDEPPPAEHDGDSQADDQNGDVSSDDGATVPAEDPYNDNDEPILLDKHGRPLPLDEHGNPPPLDEDGNVISEPTEETPDEGSAQDQPDEGQAQDGDDGDDEDNDNNDSNEDNDGDDGDEDEVEDGDEVEDDEDALITSTITSLPPEASLETLTEEITDNMVTTTTSEGSSEETLVPIIVPLSGPPVVCWNCVPLPGNVKIKTPEFCVKILGTSIGNCPANEQTNNNDEDENNDDDDDQDEEEDEQEEDCSETFTETYVSVFCSVTKDSNDPVKRQAPSTGCSSLAYSTTTACEPVQGSTTTTTIPEETEQAICMPETCGSGSCNLNPAKRTELQKRAPQPISEPEAGDWFDPSNYERYNNGLFMRGEVARAHAAPGTMVDIGDGAFVLEGETIRPRATSQLIEFGDEPVSLALNNLIGCTAVVVISEKGVWMGHFWDGGPQYIGNAFDDVHQPDLVNVMEYGLGALRNGNAADKGDWFSPQNNPRAYIISRRPRDVPEGRSVPANVGDDTVMVAEMKRRLGNNYGPVNFIYNVPEWTSDHEFERETGKVLVQYQPARPRRSCETTNKRGWRLWVAAAQPQARRKHHWNPNGDDDTAMGGQKRQESDEDCVDESDDAANGNTDSGNDDGGTEDGDEDEDEDDDNDDDDENDEDDEEEEEEEEKPLYAEGTCSFHLRQEGSSGGMAILKIDMTDNDGKDVGSYSYDKTERLKWGETTVTVESDKLPYDVKLTFNGESTEQEWTMCEPNTAGCDDPLAWRQNTIEIKVGDEEWTSEKRDKNKLPRCEVGEWNMHGIQLLKQDVPTRDMDCRWKC